MEAVLFSTGCAHMESKGVAGGLPGSIQRNIVLHGAGVKAAMDRGEIPTSLETAGAERVDVVDAKDVRWLTPEDAWMCLCTGGGGYGDPLGRDPEAVARDVRRGLCTSSEGETLYGVVLMSDGTVNSAATAQSRAAILAERHKRGTAPEAPVSGLSFDGPERFRVGEILAVRDGVDGPVLGCRTCNHPFGPAGEDPRAHALVIEREIEDLSPVNSYRAESDVILREFACPNCATLFSTDLQLRSDDPRMPEMHLKL